MTIKPGDAIPEAKLMQATGQGPQEVSTRELFAGRTVVLFGVPGAFTPTCSAKHLPGFVSQAAALKAKGADAIACIAVNDVFVMGAWGKDQGVGEDVMMLADGSGAFIKALGLEFDLTRARPGHPQPALRAGGEGRQGEPRRRRGPRAPSRSAAPKPPSPPSRNSPHNLLRSLCGNSDQLPTNLLRDFAGLPTNTPRNLCEISRGPGWTRFSTVSLRAPATQRTSPGRNTTPEPPRACAASSWNTPRGPRKHGAQDACGEACGGSLARNAIALR
jgi:peroxiredoxin (alkyl hydroperoxide reductase subunit C)